MDPIWYREPSILIRSDRLTEIYPFNDSNSRINAAVRTVLIALLLFLLFNSSCAKYILWTFIIIILITLIFDNEFYTVPAQAQTQVSEPMKNNNIINNMSGNPLHDPLDYTPFERMRDFAQIDDTKSKTIVPFHGPDNRQLKGHYDPIDRVLPFNESMGARPIISNIRSSHNGLHPIQNNIREKMAEINQEYNKDNTLVYNNETRYGHDAFQRNRLRAAIGESNKTIDGYNYYAPQYTRIYDSIPKKTFLDKMGIYE